jgi:hypothetical protein
MLKLRNNPNDFYEKSGEYLEMASKEEIISWLNSPITQAMVHNLKGDYEGAVVDWVEGRYTDSMSDGTFQKSIRALGSVQAIVDMYEWIEAIKGTNR